MDKCRCGAQPIVAEHSTACLYEFALSFLNIEDSEQLRIMFWFAKDSLEFDPKTDCIIIPERQQE
jgi:hypothetical protein